MKHKKRGDDDSGSNVTAHQLGSIVQSFFYKMLAENLIY